MDYLGKDYNVSKFGNRVGKRSFILRKAFPKISRKRSGKVDSDNSRNRFYNTAF